MNNSIQIAVFMILAILPVLLVMVLSKSQIGWTKEQKDEFWKIRLERKMERVNLMTPHCLHLWVNLLKAIQDKRPEGDIKRCADGVLEYIKLMVG